MNSQSFFGFDASIPLDEEELDDDGTYDALNDETFGSAAVGGDWEENHKQLSSLTEAERLRRAIRKDVNDLSYRTNDTDYQLENFQHNEDLQKTLENISLEKNLDKKRLFERNHGSSPLIHLQNDELSTSPSSNSIWSPNVGLEALEAFRQLTKPNANPPNQFNNFQSQPQLNGPLHRKKNDLLSFYGLGELGASEKDAPISIKTVSQLEEELKRQPSNHQGSKLLSMTLSELGKEISNYEMRANHIQYQNAHLGSRHPHPNYQNSHPRPHHNNAGNFHSGPSPPFHQNSAGSKHLGNIPHPLQYNHPMVVPNPNQMNPLNNFMGSNQPHYPPADYYRNLSGQKNRGFMQGGNNQSRNNMGDKRNFDQNFRYDQARNMHDHQREKNSGHGGGNRVRRDSDAEWEEWQRIRQADEYCGLMTPREKQWLRNIQAMQLQTENPYQDDYYYVMHNVKQQWKREEEVIEIDGLKLLLSERGKEGKEYEPPRLENSLGKLQVASVNAPRKIIDLQVVHLDSTHPTTTLQRDMRKHRHLLLHIEKLYNIHIELDDLERKIGALPDCPTRDLFRSKCRRLVGKLWSGLISPHESFVQLLCIKKGKTLVARMLNWVCQSEIEHLLATVIQNLSLLTKKDCHDKRLPLFWPYADRLFSACSASSLVTFAIMLGAQLKPQKNQFIPATASKLGLSMVLSLLVRGEEISAAVEKDEAWIQFLKDVVVGLGSLSGKDDATARPLPSVTLAASPRHPSTHLSKCREADPSALNRAIEVLKTFEEYLMKNTPLSYSSSSAGVPFSTQSQTQTKASPNGHQMFSDDNTPKMGLKML